MSSNNGRRALVAGVTGISGQVVARQLLKAGWEVYGISRRSDGLPAGVHHIKADLLDAEGVKASLAGLKPQIVFITAWIKKDSEAENIEVNGATIRNLLQGLEPDGGVRHVALSTGLKHYLGPFDNYGTAVMAETPFHEDAPRLDVPNFYYTQEDELFSAAKKQGFTWSVHRPHTIWGYAVDNAMNMVLTLSVYAEIQKALGRPFIFPGSTQAWNGVMDVTDADLLGEQLVWAATNPAGENQAFNIANGDTFRWRWLWPQIAKHFGMDYEGPQAERFQPLSKQMVGVESVWEGIAKKHGLAISDVSKLASWWHTDGDLGRQIECFTDMTKPREAGFLNFRSTPKSFFANVQAYRDANILPKA